MSSLIVSVTTYDISTYFDAWFCLPRPGLLSSGSLLAEDLNKWHFSSTTSTKENILYIYSFKLSIKLPISKYTYFELFYGLFPFIRTLTGIMGSETLVAAPAPAPTGGLHTPTSTSSTTPTSTSTSPVIFPLALHPWMATV